MHSSKLALIAYLGLVLLASVANTNASIAMYQSGWTATACTAAAITCSVPYFNNVAGRTVIVYSMIPGGANGMVSVAGPGIFTICTACESRSTTGNLPAAGGSVIDIAYTESSTIMSGNITVTRRNVGGSTWRIGYAEVGSTSAGYHIRFDAAGTNVNLATGSIYAPGPTLPVTGAGRFGLQLVMTDRASISLTVGQQIANPDWLLVHTASNYAVARNLSMTTNAGIVWTFGSAGTMLGSGIAFAEVPEITLPPITVLPPVPIVPNLGRSSGLNNNTLLTPGVEFGGGPSGGPAILNSINVTPSTIANVAFGSIVNYQATGTFSNGSQFDITPACVWDSSEQHTGGQSLISVLRRGNPQGIQATNPGATLIICTAPGIALGTTLTGTGVLEIGPMTVSPNQATFPTPLVVGTTYNIPFTITGGVPPYTITAIQGTLNTHGLTITFSPFALTGTATGTITTPFHMAFIINISDSAPIPNKFYAYFPVTLIP